jgi:hypothetical protein
MELTYGEQRTEEEKLYDEVVLARVKRGIAFCEKHYGPDWMDRIDIEELDLRSGASCILGQLEAHAEGEGYFNAVRRHWVDQRGPTRNGFCTPTIRNDNDAVDEVAWDALQQCWVDALTPRVEKLN